jgi:hypothetical protein
MAIRNRPEQELQKQIARALETILKPEVVWFHSPNGGNRSRAEAGIFKAMGVKPGVPDLIISWAGPDGPLMLAIELKAGTGKATTAQIEMMDRMRSCAWFVSEARSLDEVMALLKRYHVPVRAKL